ncbi:elongin-B-like isoform X1 [Mauremys reevesii]|uniref:elongin-B-like isoform X1 n=2 Tax=Mauremys reevesii TaxID=260615 RepID=UPI0019401ED2|nr:elongin-B-like isoform X1 [Mauremys reevesii]
MGFALNSPQLCMQTPSQCEVYNTQIAKHGNKCLLSPAWKRFLQVVSLVSSAHKAVVPLGTRRPSGAPVATMDVFLMIRRHKMTIFADAKETATVQELKKIVEGILKRPPEEQQLYKDDWLLEDGDRTLIECGLSSQTSRPQAPAMVGLALFRASEGSFEPLHIDPFSSTPELPDVLKPQDSGSSSSEQPMQ